MDNSGIKSSVKCCKNCGNCTVYKHKPYRYECDGVLVKKNGYCDRFVKDYSPAEIMRKIDRKMKELDKYPSGTYVMKELPPYRQNYRELTIEELRK